MICFAVLQKRLPFNGERVAAAHAAEALLGVRRPPSPAKQRPRKAARRKERAIEERIARYGREAAVPARQHGVGKSLTVQKTNRRRSMRGRGRKVCRHALGRS